MELFRKYPKQCLIGLFVLCSLFYVVGERSQKIIAGAADIIAIPAAVATLIVLSSLQVSQSDLHRYYNRRKRGENDERRTKDDAKKFLDEKISNTENSIRIYQNYFRSKLNDGRYNNQDRNKCKKSVSELQEFVYETRKCVELYIELDSEDGGDIDTIHKLKVKYTQKDYDIFLQLFDRFSESLIVDEPYTDEQVHLIRDLFLDKNASFIMYLDYIKYIHGNL